MNHPHRFGTLLLLCVLLSACGGTTFVDNAATSTPAAQREARLLGPVAGSYAALGASETYGVGAIPHTRGYAYLVAKALHARSFLDVGIPGATLAAAYQSELTRAVSIRPALCTTFFGFNDLRAGVSQGAFLRDLNDLVVTLQRVRCRVLIIGLPDLSILPAVRQTGVGGIHAIVQQWNAGMRRVAHQRHAQFLDLSAFSAELATHPNYISGDGLHPSNAGHARLASVVVHTIHLDNLVK